MIVVQLFVVGLCINWECLLIANEMSGLDKEKYWSLPIILRKLELSTEALPSINLRNWVIDRAVETSFAPLMLVCAKRSRTYLCCNRNKHPVVGITSTPKKRWREPISLRENIAPNCWITDATKDELFPVITRSSTST